MKMGKRDSLAKTTTKESASQLSRTESQSRFVVGGCSSRSETRSGRRSSRYEKFHYLMSKHDIGFEPTSRLDFKSACILCSLNFPKMCLILRREKLSFMKLILLARLT